VLGKKCRSGGEGGAGGFLRAEFVSGTVAATGWEARRPFVYSESKLKMWQEGKRRRGEGGALLIISLCYEVRDAMEKVRKMKEEGVGCFFFADSWRQAEIRLGVRMTMIDVYLFWKHTAEEVGKIVLWLAVSRRIRGTIEGKEAPVRVDTRRGWARVYCK
jgi:hypothetical protein